MNQELIKKVAGVIKMDNTQELGKQNRCMCCGNTIKYTPNINAYWLVGKEYVYNICPECWNRPSRQRIFLGMEGDTPKRGVA